MRERSTIRDEIVYFADQLIRTQGFNAFSYKDIAEVLEVRNAAIHHYYPTKTDLGIAVIDRDMSWIKSNRQFVRPGILELKKVVAVFNRHGAARHICLSGSLAPDYRTLPIPMQQKVREMCEGILDWVSLCLEAARSKGQLQFKGSSEDRALLFVSTLMSALLLSRVLGSTIFDKMIDQLLEDMNADWRINDLPEPPRIPAY